MINQVSKKGAQLSWLYTQNRIIIKGWTERKNIKLSYLICPNILNWFYFLTHETILWNNKLYTK